MGSRSSSSLSSLFQSPEAPSSLFNSLPPPPQASPSQPPPSQLQPSLSLPLPSPSPNAPPPAQKQHTQAQTQQSEFSSTPICLTNPSFTPVFDHRSAPVKRGDSSREALNHLVPYLAKGFVPQYTPSNGLLCALYALVGSLKAARELHGELPEPSSSDEESEESADEQRTRRRAPPKETGEITLQHLLDILFGKKKQSVKDLERGDCFWYKENSGQLRALVLETYEADEDEIEDEGEYAEIDIFRGERLSNVQDEGYDDWIVATNYKGETRLVQRNRVQICRDSVLGTRFLRKVEEFLHDRFIEEVTDESVEGTICAMREEYLHFDTLSNSQVWIILLIVNEDWGLNFGLGIIEDGYRGCFEKLRIIQEYERESQRLNNNQVTFAWKKEFHKWDATYVQDTTLYLFVEQNKITPVVWLYNDGAQRRIKAHTGSNEGIAHWSSLGLADSEFGRKIVSGWGLEDLISSCLKEGETGQVFRVMRDDVDLRVPEEHVDSCPKIGRGHFVFRNQDAENSTEMGGTHGATWWHVHCCNDKVTGWIDNSDLEPIEREWNGGTDMTAINAIANAILEAAAAAAPTISGNPSAASNNNVPAAAGVPEIGPPPMVPEPIVSDPVVLPEVNGAPDAPGSESAPVPTPLPFYRLAPSRRPHRDFSPTDVFLDITSPDHSKSGIRRLRCLDGKEVELADRFLEPTSLFGLSSIAKIARPSGGDEKSRAGKKRKLEQVEKNDDGEVVEVEKEKKKSRKQRGRK